MVDVTENSDNTIQKAVKLIENGLFKEAIVELRDFLRDHPESIEGWYNLGYALTENEEYDAANKAYDEALAIDNGIFVLWFNKGTVFYEQKDFENAKECYEKALEIDPEDAEAWNNLGNCFSRLADGRSAIDAYTRAVALRPDYAEAFYNKANAHFIEEEDEKAVAYAELALELNPALEEKISQWIHVSRNRLISKRDQEEHERRVRESSKQTD
ncbi:MAG: tetratricopeptide repeat protein [Candidatus Odinarchaeota archaeon]